MQGDGDLILGTEAPTPLLLAIVDKAIQLGQLVIPPPINVVALRVTGN